MNLRRVVLRSLPAPAMAITFALLWSGSVFAQAVDTSLWVTNGQVNAVVRDGGTIYIGGQFTRVGPATGGGVPLDAASGALPPSFPRVAGTVLAVTSDGAGGWYIGGIFTAVGGLPRLNIAHVNSDLSVSSWNPSADGTVTAIAASGSTVYVAGGNGGFVNIGGQTRPRIAAIDAVTGLATAWNPISPGDVYALAVRGPTIYAGGFFNTINGQARNRIAAIDSTTGNPTPWNPNGMGGTVNALAISGGILYAGGTFTSIGGQPRNRIAALDISTGAATSWDPNANSNVLSLAVSGSTVYAGGTFASIGGQPRGRIAALDSTTGAATSWNPSANTSVFSVFASGSVVYAAGNFTSIGGQTRNYVAALDASTGAATAWNPNLSNAARAVAVSGSTVYVGGTFTTLGGQTRNYAAALDATTGAPTAWNPNADSFVYALAVRGSTVYAGGIFNNIGGQFRSRIAAVDATTGAVTAWNPNANNQVSALAVSGSTVYAGGSFSSIGGQTRNRIAALNSAGTATPWNPNADGVVNALVVSDSIVYAGGSFGNIGGQTRSFLAALDTAATGAATAWNPGVLGGAVLALATSGSLVYAGGAFTNVGGQPRNRIASIGRTNGTPTNWNPNANGRVDALAVGGNTVYAGGVFTSIGGQNRDGIASLNAGSGMATSWNPNPRADVLALAVGPTTLYAGGAFTAMSGLAQAYVAVIDAGPDVQAVQPASGGNAGVVTVTVSGRNLRSGATVILTGTLPVQIYGTDIAVAADGSSLTATFDLTGVAIRAWDVVVTNPDLTSATLVNGFTVEASAPYEIRVNVLGPAQMRPNRRKAFDVVLENLGNSDVLNVPLWISRIPVNATVELDFALASPPQSGGEPDWSTAPLTLNGPGGKYLALVIPRLPPGTSVRRIYLTVPNTVSSFTLDAALTSPWVDGAVFRDCLSSGGVITAPSCMGAQLTAINAYLATTPGVQALSGIGLWAKIAWQCEGSASLPAALAKAEQVLDFMLQAVEQTGVPAGCEVALAPRWQDRRVVAIVTSVDPNEKLGAGGVGANRQIGSEQILPYSIRFENLQTATAPAQEVVVIDELDGATLDFTTVSLSAIKFGRRANGFPWTVEPPPGLSSYTTDVDLRPEQQLIVRVGYNLDRASGVIGWSLSSIDPATGQPPVSDLVGFLPPNITPPEGEGSLLFTVMPKPGLSGGTAIRNRATINFDGDPQQTPEWSNTLDTTPPESHVLTLGAIQDSASFTVRWAAIGAPPDLHDFSVYVSQNGAAYRPWRLHTTATADTIGAPGGGNYSFYSLARDSSGNLEAVPTTPDVQTYSRVTVEDGIRPRLALEGAVPNPAIGEARVWFTLPSRERAVLEVMDVAGRRAWRREVSAFGPGRHSVDVSAAVRAPGLYFLRLAQGDRTLRARMAVIR